MKDRYVVDTNVLIAASAIDANCSIARNATPEDPVLRMKVWQWLSEFQQSASRLVLDRQGKIEDEYRHKLGFNDFGPQVIMHKWDTCAVDWVNVEYDADGNGILDEPLQTVVHDRADRKMVAAALDAKSLYDTCAIAFAGDTDWHAWEPELRAHGLELEALIPEWSLSKYHAKLKP